MKVRYFIALTLIISGCGISKTDRSVQPIYSDSPVTTSTPQAATSTSSILPVPAKNTEVPPVKQETPSVNSVKEKEPPTLEIKQSVNLPVAFAPQAPFGVWDALHQEACEEASMIMAVKYFKGASLSPHIMEQEILNLIEWETDQGYSVDVTAFEAAKIIRDHFGLSATITTDVSIDLIKRELSAGKLIIVPAAGRELGNPFFTSPGPIYHMLMIRGYDSISGEFITNDPGTKRGEGYRYRYQTLLSAVHDWDHARAEGSMTDEEMAQGQKVIIIVSK